MPIPAKSLAIKEKDIQPQQSNDDMDIFDDSMMSTLMMMVMMIMMMAMMSQMTTSLTGQNTTTAQQLGAPFGPIALIPQGSDTDTRKPTADSTLRWIDLIHGYPQRPWITAIIQNTGDYPVEIGINSPNNRFLVYPKGNATVDSQIAKSGIAVLFYMCQQSQTADLIITGSF